MMDIGQGGLLGPLPATKSAQQGQQERATAMISKRVTAIGSFLGWIVCILGSAVRADIVEYDDKEEWVVAAGEFTTIGFADLPDGTWVTEQYAHLGVHFVDGWDQVIHGGAFLEDGAGIAGGEQIDLVFDDSMYSIAADFPGYLTIELYYQEQLFYVSNEFGVGGYGNFGGLVSTEPFDRAIIWDYDDAVFVDDLHFGPPIPAPSALWIVGAAIVAARRRRSP